MRRRDFLRIVPAGTALTLAGAGCGRAYAQRGSRPLKIGYVSPQTGPLAGFGETDNFALAGVRKAVPSLTIRQQSFPVEVIVRDSQSDPNRAAGGGLPLPRGYFAVCTWAVEEVIGAVVFFVLREPLADYGSWYMILLGGVAVGVMLAYPQGLWGLIAERWDIHVFPLQGRVGRL